MLVLVLVLVLVLLLCDIRTSLALDWTGSILNGGSTLTGFLVQVRPPFVHSMYFDVPWS